MTSLKTKFLYVAKCRTRAGFTVESRGERRETYADALNDMDAFAIARPDAFMYGQVVKEYVTAKEN